MEEKEDKVGMEGRKGKRKRQRKGRKADGKGGRKEDRHAARQDFIKETDSVKLPQPKE